MVSIRQTILETLNARGPLPVQEIANATSLSTMAARYHLGLLAREGLIVHRKAERDGRVGRPNMVYALADAALERLPKQYNLLAGELLEELAETLGNEQTRALLRRAGCRLAASIPAPRRVGGLQARLNHTVKFLTAQGYVAQWCRTGGETVTLTLCNCLYHRVAQEHPEVCEMDAALISALLEVPPDTLHCQVDANGKCQFVIERRNTSQ